MRSIKKILCYLGTLIVSVYGAIFFAVNTYLKGKWQFLFVLLYFEFMQILLLYFLKKANERIKVKKMQYIFCAILAGTTAFLFLDATEINFPRDKTTVRIEATGEKNENSKGSEIWMGGISIDGEKVNLDTIWHDSVWKYDPSINYLIATPSEYSSAIQFSCEQARKIDFDNVFVLNKLKQRITVYAAIVNNVVCRSSDIVKLRISTAYIPTHTIMKKP